MATPTAPSFTPPEPPGSKESSGIVSGLSTRPEYLVLYGIALLFFGSLAYGAVSNNIGVLAFALIGLVVLIVGAILVGRLNKGRLDSADTQSIDVGDDEINDMFRQLADNIKHGLSVGNDVFRDVIKRRCTDLQVHSENWREGRVVARFPEYNHLLIHLYANAGSQVFCTSIPEYLSTWTGPLGNQLLEAHQANKKATVVRVFIFDERDHITSEALTVIRRHSAAGVNVRIFIDKDVKALDLVQSNQNDFTIIDDGAALGLTQRFARDEIAAEWHFSSSSARVSKYKILRDELLKWSKTLAEFENVRPEP